MGDWMGAWEIRAYRGCAAWTGDGDAVGYVWRAAAGSSYSWEEGGREATPDVARDARSMRRAFCSLAAAHGRHE